MSELSAAFGGLNTAFDTNYEDRSDDHQKNALQIIKNEVAEIEERKENIRTGLIEMKDSYFLETEIKSLVLSSRSVLQRLDIEIKVGSNARMFEVYADLLNAITNQYKELRQLNESVAKLNVDQNKKSNDTHGNDKITLTADQLLEMVNSASKNSQLNKIDAQFTIEDDGVDMSPRKVEDDE